MMVAAAIHSGDSMVAIQRYDDTLLVLVAIRTVTIYHDAPRYDPLGQRGPTTPASTVCAVRLPAAGGFRRSPLGRQLRVGLVLGKGGCRRWWAGVLFPIDPRPGEGSISRGACTCAFWVPYTKV